MKLNKQKILPLRLKITPVLFRRIAVGCAAFWFLLLLPILLAVAPDKLPKPIAPWDFPDLPIDAPQWYLGASTVVAGDWKNLYPELNNEVYSNPIKFKPFLETKLFSPEKTSHSRSFYPMFPCRTPVFLPNYYPIAPLSYYPKEFWEKQHPRMQNSCFNYFYPPPTALVMAPIAAVSLETFALKLLPILTSFALFGLALLCGLIWRFLANRESYTEGIIILIFLFTPFVDESNVGNVSPILGCCFAWCIYTWLRKREIQNATSMIPPLLTKGIPIFWMPFLLLEKPIRWKTIVTLGIWTILLNLAVFICAGWSDALYVYKRFFFELVPQLTTVVGFDYVTRLAMYYGFYPDKLYTVIKIILFLLIYWGFFWGIRRHKDDSNRYLILCAALAGSICVYLFFYRLHWCHYFPFLFYLPFLPWLWMEAKRGSIWAWATILFGFPALFTIRLDWFLDVSGLYVIRDILLAPFLAISLDWVIWIYFLPGVRTLAFVFGFITALMRLFPQLQYKLSPKVKRVALTGSLSIVAIYFFLGLGLLLYRNHLAKDEATIELAAQRGDRDALMQRAYELESTNPDEAVRQYRLSGLLGNPEAFFRLGRLYEFGEVVPCDYSLAIRYFVLSGYGGKEIAWQEVNRLSIQ